MKIVVTDETITVDGWLRRQFQAKAQDITHVRLIADKAVPKRAWDRLKLQLGRMPPDIKLRAVIVWAGDQAITLDDYHDDKFQVAVDWLSRHGWDIESAIADAIQTPLVRVSVDKRP